MNERVGREAARPAARFALDTLAHFSSALIARAASVWRARNASSGPQRGIAGGEHRDREQRRVARAGAADREGRDRNAPRHLDDRVERVEAFQRAALDRHAEHRHGRLRGEHAGQVRGTAGAGDDRAQAARRGAFGIGEHLVGHAMRRDDARFVGDAELGENLGGGAEGVPVAAGAHDHADYRRGAAHGRCFRRSG